MVEDHHPGPSLTVSSTNCDLNVSISVAASCVTGAREAKELSSTMTSVSNSGVLPKEKNLTFGLGI